MVVDASVLIAWLLNEPHLSLDDAIYSQMAERTINVPAHWPAEVGNALAVNMRRGRIRMDQFHAIEQRIACLDVVVAPALSVDRIGSLVRFAANHGLTAYDAAYVLLARDTANTLTTVDDEMRAVAHRLNVPLLPV